MINQKNEIDQNKPKNDLPLSILNFTKEEKDFIKQSFRIVHKEFEDKLNIEKSDDILNGLKMYHDRYNMPGGKPHKLMGNIYQKLGYWLDGKTTLKQRERNLIEQKMANERRLAQMNLKRKEYLDKQLEAIRLEQKQIEENPLMHKFDLTQNYKKVEDEFKSKLDAEKLVQTSKLQSFLREQQEEYEKIVKEEFAKAEKAKEIIQKNAIETTINTTKEKLLDAMTNVEKTVLVPTTVENELVKQNTKIEIELHGLPSKTVPQLKIIADEKEVKYDRYTRKADLILDIEAKIKEDMKV